MKYIAFLIVVACAVGASSCTSRVIAADEAAGGNPARGKEKIAYYGCGSCHTIDGVPGASGLVGPPLTNIASRAYIAGLLPNNQATLNRWISDPQAVVPGVVMPNVHASREDVRDMVAYLETLH